MSAGPVVLVFMVSFLLMLVSQGVFSLVWYFVLMVFAVSRYHNGTEYEGEWKSNARHGFGRLTGGKGTCCLHRQLIDDKNKNSSYHVAARPGVILFSLGTRLGAPKNWLYGNILWRRPIAFFLGDLSLFRVIESIGFQVYEGVIHRGTSTNEIFRTNSEYSCLG